MVSDQKLFGSALSKRERGVGLMDFSYKTSWMGTEWTPLVASSPDLRKALASGPCLAIADDLEPVPAMLEIAIAPKDEAGHRIPVYLEGTDSLRDAVKDLVNLNGKYRGFMDDILPTHCVWLRYKTYSSEDTAKMDADKVLRRYDYAWCAQKGGSPRALALKPNVFCGCCCRTGWSIVESKPKFKVTESSFKKLVSRG